MHPDLFLRMYQQQERELEQRLLHRLAARDRSPVGSKADRARVHFLHRRATQA